MAGRFGPGWEWLGWSWVVLAAGLGLFVAERCVNRIRVKPLAAREPIRTLAVITVWVGAAVVALTIGLPRLMVLIHNYGADVSTPLAKLAYALGLVPLSACSPEGCGVTPSTAVAALNTPVGFAGRDRRGHPRGGPRGSGETAGRTRHQWEAGRQAARLAGPRGAAVAGLDHRRPGRRCADPALGGGVPDPAGPAGRLDLGAAVRAGGGRRTAAHRRELDVVAPLLPRTDLLRLHPAAVRRRAPARCRTRTCCSSPSRGRRTAGRSWLPVRWPMSAMSSTSRPTGAACRSSSTGSRSASPTGPCRSGSTRRRTSSPPTTSSVRPRCRVPWR